MQLVTLSTRRIIRQPLLLEPLKSQEAAIMSHIFVSTVFKLEIICESGLPGSERPDRPSCSMEDEYEEGVRTPGGTLLSFCRSLWEMGLGDLLLRKAETCVCVCVCVSKTAGLKDNYCLRLF